MERKKETILTMHANANMMLVMISPDVIVNTTCPGLVNTELGRSASNMSWLMRLVVPLYLSLLGKSADYGARFYVAAARTAEDEHVSNILDAQLLGN